MKTLHITNNCYGLQVYLDGARSNIQRYDDYVTTSAGINIIRFAEKHDNDAVEYAIRCAAACIGITDTLNTHVFRYDNQVDSVEINWQNINANNVTRLMAAIRHVIDYTNSIGRHLHD